MNADDGRGENQRVARRMGGWGSGYSMKGNKSTHAFATPYDARFRMPMAEQLGKGSKVIKPVLRILDVSSAGKDRVIALSTEVRRINCHGGLAVLQVAPKGIPVAGSSRYSMKSHNHCCGGLPTGWKPFPVGKPGPVKRGICRFTKLGGCNLGGCCFESAA